MIELARGNAADASDIGIFGKYVSGGETKYSGLFRDVTDGVWNFFKDTKENLTSATVIKREGTGYTISDVRLGNLDAEGLYLGEGSFNGAIDAEATLKAGQLLLSAVLLTLKLL